MAYLGWDGGQWILRWGWLERDFNRGDLVVRARKSLKSGKLGTSDPLASWPLDELEINGIKYKRV